MKTKSADASALANAAQELLRQGDAVGAERVLAPVFADLRADAGALHLMGQIKRAQNQFEEAERHLRSAIAQALSEGSYYNDLGAVLQARGEFVEAARIYRAAIVLLPHSAVARVNLVRVLVAAGELEDAESEARAYIAKTPGAESWTLLHQVHRAQERNQDALRAAEQALQCSPRMRGLRLNYAAALDRIGRTNEALPVYEGLVKEDIETPDLALAFARALYSEGRKRDAESVLEQAITLWSSVGNLHGALARMRWLRGAGVASTSLIEAEMKKRPGDLALKLLCADVLHRGRHDERALEILEASLRAAPNEPSLLTARGIVLDELDRPQEAVQSYTRALEVATGAIAAERNLLWALLRAGKPDEAIVLARGLRRAAPDDQYLIACVATALRMMGDAAYQRFHDYDRYVRTYDIPAPRGFFTVDNFNASLAEALRMQHRTNAHMLDQTLDYGSQTGRSLLTLEEPNLRVFFAAVDAAVKDYVAKLPLSIDDPVGRRKRDRQRISSCWSVLLGNAGFQPNHVHEQGWLSSAYYAALSPASGRDRAGWLKFGEPHRPIRGCGPDHFVEPRVGKLVLFPSYMWHGTVPFEGVERLSLAFDVTPV